MGPRGITYPGTTHLLLQGLRPASGRTRDYKPHAINNPYLLGRAMELQAVFWYKECRIEAAELEALRAISLYEKLEATKHLWSSKRLLRWIERMDINAVTADKPDSEGNFL